MLLVPRYCGESPAVCSSVSNNPAQTELPPTLSSLKLPFHNLFRHSISSTVSSSLPSLNLSRSHSVSSSLQQSLTHSISSTVSSSLPSLNHSISPTVTQSSLNCTRLTKYDRNDINKWKRQSTLICASRTGRASSSRKANSLTSPSSRPRADTARTAFSLPISAATSGASLRRT